jgi:hypothetical protein
LFPLRWDGHGVGPFSLKRFDEPLGFDVRPAGVGLGADRLEIHQGAAGLSPLARATRGAVVRENTTADDPLRAEPVHSPGQEADRGGLLLVGQHLDVGQAGGVIHRDVDLLVASAT